MGRVDVAAAKRAGLPVDLDRLAREGDGWLSDAERLALKKYGICPQGQPGVFMVRIRTSGGVVTGGAARRLAALADRYGRGWIHLTTRQQMELHHVAARDVPAVIEAVEAAGLTTAATCGHTVRGVLACPTARDGLDEPFDCHPDARALSDSVLRRTPALECLLPQRVNISFGGCAECRDHARINDVAFVSTLVDGDPAYDLWIGGSLGKAHPTLSWPLRRSLGRAEVLPAIHALLDVFTTHGDLDRPQRARLKHLVADVGRDDLAALWEAAFVARARETWPAPQPTTTSAVDVAAVLVVSPPGGWRRGVRPQRRAGLAVVTVAVPLGDLDSEDLCGLVDAAERHGDGGLTLTPDQNLLVHDVAVSSVPSLCDDLDRLGLAPLGTEPDARACTGAPVCALAVAPAAALGDALRRSAAVRRHPELRMHVSGCPNGCAQHQVADIGYSGTHVTVAGQRRFGYQIWVGADLRRDRIGEVVGRVPAVDTIAVTDALIGAWESLAGPGESLATTLDRVGLDVVRDHVSAVFTGRWAPGPEPGGEPPPTPIPAAMTRTHHRAELPLVGAR